MSSRPVEPKEEDCCRNSCTNCVFDVYARALEKWELGQFDTNQRSDFLSLTSFEPFLLSKIDIITSSTNLYTFKPQTESKSVLFSYNAGQHLSLRVDKLSKVQNSKSTFVVRDFTIISKQQSSFKVVIKLYDNSETSSFIRELQEGDVTYWRGPFGDYKYLANKYSCLVMLCMGTGIAPMYSIIKEILLNEKDETIINLLYGSKKSSDIIFRNELNRFISYWNFKCIYYLSEECHLGNKHYNEEVVLSRISEVHISDVIQNKLNCFYLLCGSSAFINDMRQYLNVLSIPEDRIHIF